MLGVKRTASDKIKVNRQWQWRRFSSAQKFAIRFDIVKFDTAAIATICMCVFPRILHFFICRR